jgi:transcriptional regulator with XRE-family HTH domain
MKTLNKISDRLKELRLSNNETLEGLSQKTDISYTSIFGIENNKNFRIETLLKVLKIYDLEINFSIAPSAKNNKFSDNQKTLFHNFINSLS